MLNETTKRSAVGTSTSPHFRGSHTGLLWLSHLTYRPNDRPYPPPLPPHASCPGKLAGARPPRRHGLDMAQAPPGHDRPPNESALRQDRASSRPQARSPRPFAAKRGECGEGEGHRKRIRPSACMSRRVIVARSRTSPPHQIANPAPVRLDLFYWHLVL